MDAEVNHKAPTLCSECGTSLPIDSHFCPKCGRPVTVAADSAELGPARLFCPKCGASLPDDSGCLRCKQEGNAVAHAGAQATASSAAAGATAAQRRARSRPRSTIWLLLSLLVMLAAIWWAATSDNPRIQELRETISGFRTESIVDSTFLVKPHSFSSYKFAVPAGTSGVSVSGLFNTVGSTSDQVEVYLLSDAAFATWQNGYSTTNYYESGKVAKDNIVAPIPSGDGVYYVVFSNKSSLRSPATVHATLTLRYNKWLPDWIFHIKETLWGQ